MRPDFDAVRAAAERLRGAARRTPLLESDLLNAAAGRRVLVKAEALQRTGSFKFRGAFNRLARLSPPVRERGVVACSSGNHAQGLAEAARFFGVPATIVMPSDAPAVKRVRTERSGARVVPYDRAREDRDAIAEAIAAETGATFVHPFEDRDVIAGQGTVGLEIAADCRALGATPDAVLVPASGGGLVAGVALALADVFPGVAVHTVEPADFDDHARSLAAGAIVANDRGGVSIADALLAPRPGDTTFGINSRLLAPGLVATEAQMLAAVGFALAELKLVVEPGGAAGLAALLAGALPGAGRTIVVVLSGGNADPAIIARALGA